MKINILDTLRRHAKRYSRREQVLLLTCGVLVSLTVLWQLVWQPVMAARAISESRLVYAVESLDNVNSLAAELEFLRQSDVDADDMSGATQSLPQRLDTLSAQMGIVVASLEPAADNLSAGLRFDAVDMSDLLTWASELESQSGLQIEQMTIVPVSADTGSGQPVNATLRVRSLR